MLVATGTILHPRFLSLEFIGALNLFHNLVTDLWHVTAEGGSSFLPLNSLHLHWTCNSAISSVWNINAVRGLISNSMEASDSSLISVK